MSVTKYNIASFPPAPFIINPFQMSKFQGNLRAEKNVTNQLKALNLIMVIMQIQSESYHKNTGKDQYVAWLISLLKVQKLHARQFESGAITNARAPFHHKLFEVCFTYRPSALLRSRLVQLNSLLRILTDLCQSRGQPV